MSGNNIIEIENLSKRYLLGETKISVSNSSLRNNHNELRDSRVSGNVFWALRDINLSIQQGEVLGIIGKNGAGKSTLLKILSHITTPTSGKIKIKGTFASLLEVGTGFHPELSGRENIYLNGAILGLTKQEIKKQLDSIIDFSGIKHHIDSPVKRYSSGMKVRLGFAVAAHLTPDILIIDEVLAVGDAEFQAKCLGKIGEVTESGRTVLFVSHNMAAVKSLCTSAVLLNNGKIESIGSSANVLEKYISLNDNQENLMEAIWPENDAPGLGEVKLLSVRTLNENNETRSLFYSSQIVKIELRYKVSNTVSGSRFILQIKDSLDTIAFTSTNQLIDPLVKLPGYYTTICTIPSHLLNHGHYKVFINMDIFNFKHLIKQFTPIAFDVILMGNNGSLQENWPGIIAPVLKWETLENTKTNS